MKNDNDFEIEESCSLYRIILNKDCLKDVNKMIQILYNKSKLRIELMSMDKIELNKMNKNKVNLYRIGASVDTMINCLKKMINNNLKSLKQ